MKQKNYLTRTLLLFALIVGSTSVWGQSTKTEGFETKTTSTIYNSTVTISTAESDCGIAWSIYYGTVSTNDKISGNKSAQMRWYSSAKSNIPFIKSTTAVENLTKIDLKAGTSNLNVKMDISYSTDGETWTVGKTYTFTETGKGESVSLDIPTGNKYVKFGVSSSSTAPSSDSYKLIVDDVVFTYTETVDDRQEASLAFETEEQTINVGETLTAPTLTNPNNLTVTYSSDKTSVATVDANGNVTGVAPGTATITASFDGNTDYKPGSASYTITVKKVAPVGAFFYESFDNYTEQGGNDGIWNNAGSTELKESNNNIDNDNEGWDFSKVYPANMCIKINTSSSKGYATTPTINFVSGKKYKISFDAGAWNSSKETTTFTLSTTAGTLNVSSVELEKSKFNTYEVILTSTGEGTITFAPANASNNRVFLDEVLITEIETSVTATITSAGYATFSSDKNVDFSANEGLTVYTAKDNGTSVTLNEVASKTVPANTAVVLKGAAGDYTGTVVASAEALADNDLKVATEDLNGNGRIYVLNKVDDKVGFYKLSTTGTLSKGKAYLETENAAPFLGFDGEGTTGINTVERGALSVEGCYTLDGRRVAQPTKGMYIVNGKKIILK